ncbi:unnamed protein product [Rotaria sp. Silwood2]|nr:unnamed protein product [Rotaria sp. Silwood2]CAF3384824.1 unnamed protein product [Rotaria sp. Silwood2]CAF3481038.1 unnamed protein product [Rotaria sp. Silwood2]CAF4565225.1 unnamed protein product [Rotaria sp. Silwood2]CAF4600586.1 unnamed protein product [Rotaria sp. Silwood2]
MSSFACNTIKMKKSQGREQPQTGLSDNASKDLDDHKPGGLVLDCVESKDSEHDHTSKEFQDHPEKDIVHDILPTTGRDVYGEIEEYLGIIQNIDGEVAQMRQKQTDIWADIRKKERELLTLVKGKQIDAKKKEKEIYDLIAMDSQTDVSIKTYEEDKKLNQEKILKKPAEIFAGDNEEGFVVNPQELKGSEIGDKEEILFDDDSELFVPASKRLQGSHHGGNEERYLPPTREDAYDDIRVNTAVK